MRVPEGGRRFLKLIKIAVRIFKFNFNNFLTKLLFVCKKLLIIISKLMMQTPLKFHKISLKASSIIKLRNFSSFKTHIFPSKRRFTAFTINVSNSMESRQQNTFLCLALRNIHTVNCEKINRKNKRKQLREIV
jgi:hypothetical protein